MKKTQADIRTTQTHSQKLTQLKDDDSWNIEWEQQGTLFDTMHFTSWREKCLGVQLGVDSEFQSDTLTTEPRTMTPGQSMKHQAIHKQFRNQLILLFYDIVYSFLASLILARLPYGPKLARANYFSFIVLVSQLKSNIGEHFLTAENNDAK